MQIRLKISILFICLLKVIITLGQNETYILPFSNKVEINPAFAGLNRNSTFNSGNQYYQINKNQIYNQFYSSWSWYSKKRKGGIAVSFNQGLISEKNISVTEFGYSYAGFKKRTENGNIYFSVGSNLSIATKQWTVALLDKIFVSKTDTPSPPGREFLRYTIIKPKASFLWTNESLYCGLTAAIPYRIDIASDAIEPVKETIPASLTFYLSKKIDKRLYGLYSKPIKITPELIVFYHEELFLSRIKITSDVSDYNWGFFIQDDYTNNAHIVGGTLGYNYNYIKINLYSGIGIPGLSSDTPFMAELSFKINVPPYNHSKLSPWSIKENSSFRRKKYKSLRKKQKKHEDNFNFRNEQEKKEGKNRSLLYILKHKYKR